MRRSIGWLAILAAIAWVLGSGLGGPAEAQKKHKIVVPINATIEPGMRRVRRGQEMIVRSVSNPRAVANQLTV